MAHTYRHDTLAIRSEALRGNPLGDPFERTLHVLVPEKADGPLPVIWILGGYSATPGSVLADEPWSEGLQRRLGRLSAEGTLPPVIVAVPDCFTALGGSQYLDSAAVGRYESYLWDDCRVALEARYSCGKHGVAGKSSGGFGALVQAMRRPEHVRAVACHSGDMYFEYCYLASFPALANALRKHGGVEGFLAAFAAARKKRKQEWFDPIQTLCMAACYSPDPAQAGGIALPFDPETAAIRLDVWSRWLAHDPVRMVDEPANAERLRGLDLLFLDAGTRDEFHLQWGLRQLVAKLRAQGISHEHEEFEDGHFSTSYRYDVSLPKLARALRE
ncbi:alpha/beta hydrolase [Vulgatibacter incomptus]|uniref:Putative esterase n=1 Tax=Vulgatibacter incomptus TaxID=1391653 RepID=A0A0K1PFQ7_9BACT|nr:alpha/beta hydrolase-fold protein [Vulgatibacter incomptus]AKU92368.1 putative esterase [Vulgatibacter incomptus]